MKKSILSIFMLIMISAVLAQVPQAINYQAVARDAAGNIIANQNISFRLSILQGGPLGTVVYSETHLETSNQFGMVTMEIGWGTVISGVYLLIDWRLGAYYLKTEMDPTGGTNYQEMGTSEFLTVPYAIYTRKTLNAAYADGRIIDADSGPVQINVPSNKFNHGLWSRMLEPNSWYGAIIGYTEGLNFALKAEINNPANTSAAIWGLTNAIGAGNAILGENLDANNTDAAIWGRTFGLGQGIRGEIIENGLGPVNADDAILGLTNGIGNAGHFSNTCAGAPGGRAIFGEITNPANSSDAIFVKTVGSGRAGHFLNSGTGPAILAIINEPTNTNLSDAVHAVTNGLGHAIYAQTFFPGNASQTIRAVQNGIGDAIRGDISVADDIDNTYDAIFGTTNGTGNAGHFLNTGPGLPLPAGGTGGSAVYAEINNADNPSSAIRGITNGNGHAIRGRINKAGNLKPAILGENVNPAGIGLFGRVPPPALDPWQAPLVPNIEGCGVLGISGETYGVIGQSESESDLKAGVKAIGNGVDENGNIQAAALEINNGAIIVSGISRPAGTDTITGYWGPIPSSTDLIDIHDHAHHIGSFLTATIGNALVVPESIIQLTVQNPIGDFPCFVEILSINPGGFSFRVGMLGCPGEGDNCPTPPFVVIHYLIINPE